MQRKWDLRFIEMAKLVSSWSKDPSTKVGAVITDASNRVISVGYNGFPKHIEDSPEKYSNRDLKYKMIVHAERNALLFAGVPLLGCTLYTYPFGPCPVCAGMIIQSGITRVVFPKLPEELVGRWQADLDISEQMFFEARLKSMHSPSGFIMSDPIMWDPGYVGTGIMDTGMMAFSGQLSSAIRNYMESPKFEHWTTAKCFDCGKFFKVNGGWLIGGGPAEECPHCGAKGNI